MIKIYRFEHKETGLGPLCGEHSIDWNQVFYHHEYPMHSIEFVAFADRFGWDHLGPNRVDGKYRFGCPSIDAIIDLLRDDGEEILNFCDFQLVEYEIDEEDDYCLFYSNQVVFDITQARMCRVI